MARIRSIHPGIFTDEAFVSVPPLARLLLMGLWCEADDNGIFEWKPVTLKMRLFPADDVDVVSLLEDLSRVLVITQFEDGGRTFGAVRNFCRYQKPKAPKAVHPLPEKIRVFVAADGQPETGSPMPGPKDVTASDRKRRQRERERDEAGNGHDSSSTKEAECHGSAVTVSAEVTDEARQIPTNSEMSRQREEGGGKEKEEAHASSKKTGSKGTRITLDWQPDHDERNFAEAQGLTPGTVQMEADKFRDYWLSVSGQRAVKADWRATWRTWIRKAVQDRKGPKAAQAGLVSQINGRPVSSAVAAQANRRF